MFLNGKQILRLTVLIIILAAIWFGIDGLNSLDNEVNLEDSFEAPLFIESLTGVHSIVADKLGNFWVSQPQEGTVSLISVDESGEVGDITQIFSGLNKPTELAIEPNNKLTLFIVEDNKISYVRLYTEDVLHKLTEIPEGTDFINLSFTEDGSLLVVEESTGRIYGLDGNFGYNDSQSENEE
jgi:hypothetical protein